MASNDPRFSIGSVADVRAGAPAIDQGLRAFMLAVYNHMALGVAITGAVALGAFLMAVNQVDGQIVGLTGFGQAIFNSPLKWVVILSPLAVVLWMSFGAERMTAATARTLFYLYAALVGLSLSVLFLVYTGNSIARVFFVSAATFGALSLYGYTTKRDLSAMGSFLMMGLFGLIIASIVNLFLASSAMEFVITLAGVLIFAGLTAWDTQKLKSIYLEGGSHQEMEKSAIFGALNLYLDFINLFLFMLRMLGDRR
jgi:FtsH-binding integral membrane protein